jgi:uncharacterized membrane protein
LGSLVVVFIVFLTAVTVVVLGILAAYGIVAGILYAFAYHSQRSQRSQVLVPSETHASGD